MRAKHTRARRQRWTMIAAAAAVFVFAAHSFASPNFHVASSSSNVSPNPSWNETADTDLGTQSAGAMAMGSVADGGRETD
ncbi:MAG: hypothetical protein ACRELY_21760 [Polyangiaceae bacterium]